MRRLLKNERAVELVVRALTSRAFQVAVVAAIAALAAHVFRHWGLWPIACAVVAAVSFALGWGRAYAFWRKHGYVSKL